MFGYHLSFPEICWMIKPIGEFEISAACLALTTYDVKVVLLFVFVLLKILRLQIIVLWWPSSNDINKHKC